MTDEMGEKKARAEVKQHIIEILGCGSAGVEGNIHFFYSFCKGLVSRSISGDPESGLTVSVISGKRLMSS